MIWKLEYGGLLNGFKQEDCHIRCMGHVINLSVQTLLKGLRITAIKEEVQLADDDIEVKVLPGLLSKIIQY